MSRDPSQLQPGDKLGRFTVERKLAEGGMGAVWVGVDPDGRRAAIKVVVGASESLLVSLRQEIRALLRIDHPSVVRVVEHGLYDALPWFAMEFIAGEPMRAWVDAARDTVHLDSDTLGLGSADTLAIRPDEEPARDGVRPLPGGPTAASPPPSRSAHAPVDLASREATLRLMVRVTEGLAFMHEAGVVHRDLKPENIVVREEDGRPVIVDFGTATSGADQRLTKFRGVAGTPAYIAPEQALGERVDARADLYSIGCMLFEIIAGSTPFSGSSVFELMSAHVRAPIPPLPSNCPPALVELVQCLLAKDPAARPAFAADVASRLAAVLGEPDLVERRPSPYLCRPGLVGRAELIESMERAVVQPHQTAGGVLVVVGEPGAGKTRVINELAHRLERRSDLSTVVVDMNRPDAPSPFTAMLMEIADRCRERGPAFTRDLLARNAGVLAKQYPALLELPGVDATDVVPDLPRQFEAMRRTRAWSDVIVRAYAPRKVVMLVDEYEPAFAELLDNFRTLQLLEPSPLVLVVTADPSHSELVEEASGAGLFELRELDRDQTRQMAGSALGVPAVPDDIAEVLYERTMGNPAAITRLLSRALAEGLVVQGEIGERSIAARPEPWRALDASPDARRALESVRNAPSLVVRGLRAIALEPEGIELAILPQLLGGRRAIKVLDDWLRDGTLVLHREHVAFHDENLRRAVLALGGEGDESALHLAVARALELVAPDELLDRARHLVAGGDTESARSCFQEALSAPLPPAVDEARVLREFLALEPPDSADTLRALQRYARLCAIRGRVPEACRAGRLAVEMANRMGDETAEALELSSLARSLLVAGEDHEAVGRRGLVLAQKTGDPEALCRAFTYLSTAATHRGDLAEAARFSAMAHGAAPRSDPYLWGWSGLSHTAALVSCDRYDAAESLLRVLLEHSRSHGLRRLEGLVLLNLAVVAREGRARFVEAQRLLDRAYAALWEAHDRSGLGGVQLERLVTLVRLGAFEQALEAAQEGFITRVRGEFDPRRVVRAQIAMFSALIGLGRYREAEVVVDAVDAIAFPVAGYWRRLLEARLRRLQGDYEGAAVCLDELRDASIAEFDLRYSLEVEERLHAIACGADPRDVEDPPTHGRPVTDYAAMLRDRLRSVRDAADRGEVVLHGELVEPLG